VNKKRPINENKQENRQKMANNGMKDDGKKPPRLMPDR